MPIRIPRQLGILKPFVRQQFHFWGGPQVYRARHKADLRILMYHNFPPDQAGLRRQCEHIRRHYAPVSLGEVSTALDGGRALPGQAVAITVDDGYRDFLTSGFPVFREFDIPVTVYLVSDFLDGKQWLWWNRIEYGMEHCRRDLTLQIGEASIPVTAGSFQEAAFEAVCQALKKLPNTERVACVETILRDFDVVLPNMLPEKWAPLSWDEVRNLSQKNVEFGAHTKTHPILSSISSPDQLRAEIAGSKARLEEELSFPVLHFCYPNGKKADIGQHALEIAREAGLRTGVTSEPGMNRIDGQPDRLQLRRLGASPTYAVEYFSELLAGVRAA